ncbi:NAD-dependent epimerase/dehydratase family protein [Paracraurococcus ruber]|uniref:NAD-dependent epimerase/dehydratase family protein n=1 Tax=Paracraurococcus ruber TaxID=77675 RepID=UPI0019059765|nr:SDR family oxidoreductase [Paracraurococcus ruber]
MRVLMTGHLGYIGTVAVPLFQEGGHEVTGCDTDLYRACTFGKDLGPAGGIRNLGLDIRDVTADHLRGFDAVVHYGGIPNDPLGDLDPEVTMQINTEATVSLARAAKAAGVPRFVFSSSCSNYGAAGENFLDEQGAFNPVTAYGRSKVAAEKGLLPLADDRFSPVLMRSATAFGVSPRLRFDLVINNLTAWACATGDILLKSDGTPWRAVVHIEDIARAFRAVVEAPRDLVLQCRLDQRELPDPGTRPDGRAGGARHPGALRRGRRARPAVLSGELRQAGAGLPACRAALDRAHGRGAAA